MTPEIVLTFHENTCDMTVKIFLNRYNNVTNEKDTSM